jgi:hypothetical protein
VTCARFTLDRFVFGLDLDAARHDLHDGALANGVIAERIAGSEIERDHSALG